MRIEIDGLEELGGKFAQVYGIDDLPLGENDIRLVEPMEARGRIQRHGDEIELQGELQAKIEALCSRCLKPVRLPIHLEFAERFVPAVSWRAEAQHELLEEDLNLSIFNGAAIELDDLVREEILLAMPDHVLCCEDCEGLCPVCGIDKNVERCQCETDQGDSRWEKLKDLRI